MLFKLTNTNAKRSTHCGVLEFVADEGKVYLPHWVSKVYENATFVFVMNQLYHKVTKLHLLVS